MIARGSSPAFDGRVGTVVSASVLSVAEADSAAAGAVGSIALDRLWPAGTLDIGGALTHTNSGAGGSATLGTRLLACASGFGGGRSTTCGTGAAAVEEGFIRSADGDVPGRGLLMRGFTAGKNTSKAKITPIGAARITPQTESHVPSPLVLQVALELVGILGMEAFYRRTDKHDEAKEHLTTATTMYHEMGMRFSLEKAPAETKELG
jgi:hypothetical protein